MIPLLLLATAGIYLFCLLWWELRALRELPVPKDEVLYRRSFIKASPRKRDGRYVSPQESGWFFARILLTPDRIFIKPVLHIWQFKAKHLMDVEYEILYQSIAELGRIADFTFNFQIAWNSRGNVGCFFLAHPHPESLGEMIRKNMRLVSPSREQPVDQPGQDTAR